jgi:hypothetical protein
MLSDEIKNLYVDKDNGSSYRSVLQ